LRPADYDGDLDSGDFQLSTGCAVADERGGKEVRLRDLLTGYTVIGQPSNSTGPIQTACHSDGEEHAFARQISSVK